MSNLREQVRAARAINRGQVSTWWLLTLLVAFPLASGVCGFATEGLTADVGQLFAIGVIRPTRLVARGGGLGRLRRETRPPRARRGQHARVAEGVQAGWGGTLVAAGTAATAGQVHRDRAVGIGLLEGDAHQAVGPLLHALLRNRRAQHVAQQRLPPRPGAESSARSSGSARQSAPRAGVERT